MNFKLPKIYAITDTGLSGLSHLEQVEQLIDGGIELIQLREKSATARDFYNSAASVLTSVERDRVKILINDRVDIAAAVGADGVHLGQDDLSPEYARKILGQNAIIGFSTHTEEQVRQALKFPVDYLAFGPVYDTTTKKRPDAVVGLDSLKAVKAMADDMPIVAIGGIGRHNLYDILAAGADTAAIISALVSDGGRIASNAKELILIAEQITNSV